MMASQNDEKALISSMASARSCSFSAETIVLLGTERTCFKHDGDTPGNIDGGPVGIFLPLTFMQSQSK